MPRDYRRGFQFKQIRWLTVEPFHSVVLMSVRIGILTAGGDCPGLNAVIRAVVRRALVEDAQVLGIPTVFALTYQVDFFKKLGFEIVEKNILSQKVWQDCQFCSKQDCCDEVAMILRLDR